MVFWGGNGEYDVDGMIERPVGPEASSSMIKSLGINILEYHNIILFRARQMRLKGHRILIFMRVRRAA